MKHTYLLLLLLSNFLFAQSSDEIRVYFNNSVDASLATTNSPNGTSSNALINAILQRINQAESTIDVAMYNTSYHPLVNALEDAVDRGVRVRYIKDSSTGNSALNNPNFPVLRKVGDGLMHNKFFIIDAVDAENCWLIQGSTNMTYNGIEEEYNNLMMIQHQGLAQAYQTEFEEMWGSTGNSPNAGLARFGNEKRDNTPHEFMVNGKLVECYFSPSDDTSNKIINSLESAEETVDFAIFAFTLWELSDAIIATKNRGVKVRGLLEEDSDQYSAYQRLVDANVNVDPHAPNKVIHHKYAIIDANSSDPQVVSGSHNWSFSAETRNDENTLIVHDATIANLFSQEFEARWDAVVPVQDLANPNSIALQVYPNPVVDVLKIEGDLETSEDLNVTILNPLGQPMIHFNYGKVQGNFTKNIDLSQLPMGTYVVLINGQYGQEIIRTN